MKPSAISLLRASRVDNPVTGWASELVVFFIINDGMVIICLPGTASIKSKVQLRTELAFLTSLFRFFLSACLYDAATLGDHQIEKGCCHHKKKLRMGPRFCKWLEILLQVKSALAWVLSDQSSLLFRWTSSYLHTSTTSLFSSFWMLTSFSGFNLVLKKWFSNGF